MQMIGQLINIQAMENSLYILVLQAYSFQIKRNKKIGIEIFMNDRNRGAV